MKSIRRQVEVTRTVYRELEGLVQVSLIIEFPAKLFDHLLLFLFFSGAHNQRDVRFLQLFPRLFVFHLHLSQLAFLHGDQVGLLLYRIFLF